MTLDADQFEALRQSGDREAELIMCLPFPMDDVDAANSANIACLHMAARRLARAWKAERLDGTGLALQAFEVMLRRKWAPICGPSGWFAVQVSEQGTGVLPIPGVRWEPHQDPFTAVVEADRLLSNLEAT